MADTACTLEVHFGASSAPARVVRLGLRWLPAAVLSWLVAPSAAPMQTVKIPQKHASQPMATRIIGISPSGKWALVRRSFVGPPGEVPLPLEPELIAVTKLRGQVVEYGAFLTAGAYGWVPGRDTALVVSKLPTGGRALELVSPPPAKSVRIELRYWVPFTIDIAPSGKIVAVPGGGGPPGNPIPSALVLWRPYDHGNPLTVIRLKFMVLHVSWIDATKLLVLSLNSGSVPSTSLYIINTVTCQVRPVAFGHGIFIIDMSPYAMPDGRVLVTLARNLVAKKTEVALFDPIRGRLTTVLSSGYPLWANQNLSLVTSWTGRGFAVFRYTLRGGPVEVGLVAWDDIIGADMTGTLWGVKQGRLVHN